MSPATSVLLGLVGVAAAAIGSAMCVRAITPWAVRLGLFDEPNHRSSHARPVPRVGGIAIVAVTGLAAIATGCAAPASWPALAAVLLPALAVAGVSLADDIREVPIAARFTVHVAAAAAATAALGPIEVVPMGPNAALSLGPLAWPLTLLWIAGLTNAFNFMDGIDGIAGLTAVVAGGALAVGGLASGTPVVSLVAAALAASAAGFLRANWPPAAIFMGDVGSTFLGFTLAVLPLAAGPAAPLLVAVVGAAAWPFVFDTAFTLLRRLLRRENVVRAHRSHLYQRLVAAGASHASVALLYGTLSLAGAMLALIPACVPGAGPTVPGMAAVVVALAGAGLVAGTSMLERRSRAA